MNIVDLTKGPHKMWTSTWYELTVTPLHQNTQQPLQLIAVMIRGPNEQRMETTRVVIGIASFLATTLVVVAPDACYGRGAP